MKLTLKRAKKNRHFIGLAIMAAAIIVSGCSSKTQPDPRVGPILDRIAVQDTVNELFRAADLKDWRRAKVVFDEKVNVDAAPLLGGDPGEMTPPEITDAWAGTLGPAEAVHHQTGNFAVRLAEYGAYVTCYVTSTRYRPDRQESLAWDFGTFDLHLVRKGEVWKIDAMRYKREFGE